MLAPQPKVVGSNPTEYHETVFAGEYQTEQSDCLSWGNSLTVSAGRLVQLREAAVDGVCLRFN